MDHCVDGSLKRSNDGSLKRFNDERVERCLETKRPLFGVAWPLTFAAMLAVLCACAPRAPGIADPVRVDGHCGPRQARVTSIRSVMTTTNDRLVPGDHPTFAEIQSLTRSGDGAIAYWKHQRVLLPQISQQLGESGGYAHIRAVAIPPALDGAQSRRIYFLARDHGRYRWIALDAFDVQDVCIEGHLQS